MRIASLRSMVFVTIFGGLVAWASPAEAAIYMKYGSIQGDVTAAGYEKTIALDAYSVAVSRGISSPTGGSSDRESSAPTISNFSVVGPASSASVDLFNEAMDGQGQTVNIYLTQTMMGKQVTEAEWDLTNTMIASFATSSGGSTPTDSLSLDFTKIQYKWYKYDATGAQTGSVTAGWDLSTAQPMFTSAATGDTTGFAFITSVPEPASLGTLLLAGPAMLMRRRRA